MTSYTSSTLARTYFRRPTISRASEGRSPLARGRHCGAGRLSAFRPEYPAGRGRESPPGTAHRHDPSAAKSRAAQNRHASAGPSHRARLVHHAGPTHRVHPDRYGACEQRRTREASPVRAAFQGKANPPLTRCWRMFRCSDGDAIRTVRAPATTRPAKTRQPQPAEARRVGEGSPEWDPPRAVPRAAALSIRRRGFGRHRFERPSRVPVIALAGVITLANVPALDAPRSAGVNWVR